MTTTTKASDAPTSDTPKKRKRRKKSDDVAGRGKLLDAWISPDDAGGPIGCLATTFTLDAAFFEEHCLGRFLALETVPEESGAQYLIERETKLREAYCAVLADRRQAGDERSLAWDILSVYVPNGCMHAKVSLLEWANHIRVIVASANLTSPGYRSNLETYAVFDFADGVGDDRALLNDVVSFLQGVLGQARDDEAVRARGRMFLHGVLARASGWKEAKRNPAHPDVRFVPSGNYGGVRRSALETLRDDVWRTGGPPRHATVLSPFFDKDPRAAVAALREVLAKRGETSLRFWCAVQNAPDGSTIVQAPPLLPAAFKDGDDIFAVQTTTESETRPLHAKSLFTNNERRAAWMLGSSNFTSAGLGIGTAINIEANVVFTASLGSDADKLMEAAEPDLSDEVDPATAKFEPAFEAAACGDFDMADALPVAFECATFARAADGVFAVEVSVDVAKLPARWWIVASDRTDANEVLVRSESASLRTDDEGRASLSITWPHAKPPSSLEVHWIGDDGVERQAMLSVNVVSQDALPILDDLRDLSLETLLDILTMAKPLHEAVARSIARKQQLAARTTAGELDPHKRVDTQQFLIQRTKRFARALEGLKRRLEEPAFSIDAWRNRLHGSLGPLALAKAVEREATDPGERCFLVAEMILVLKTLAPREQRGAIPVEERLAEVRALRQQLRASMQEHIALLPADMRRYVERATEEAGSDIAALTKTAGGVTA